MPGFDGFGDPGDGMNLNDDDQVDQGEPNAPDQHDPEDDDQNMVTEQEAQAEDDDDSFVQTAQKVAKQSPGFDGFGAPDPFNRNDDDEVDQGEPNAPEQHDPSDDDANMVTEQEAAAEDDDSFMQVARKSAKQAPGFDGFGTPDPFNR